MDRLGPRALAVVWPHAGGAARPGPIDPRLLPRPIVRKGPHSDGETIGRAKAAELQRLRAFFRDSFIELQLTCHDTGRVLASTLVPLAEEKNLRLLFTAERGFFSLDPHHSLQLPGYALAVTLLHPGDGQERPPLTVCLVSGAGLRLHDHRMNIRGNRSIGEYMHVMRSDAVLVLPNLAVVHALTFHASVMSEMVGNEDAASDVKLWLDVSAVRENGPERMYPTELVDMYMLLHACVERQRMLEGLETTRLGSTMDDGA